MNDTRLSVGDRLIEWHCIRGGIRVEATVATVISVGKMYARLDKPISLGDDDRGRPRPRTTRAIATTRPATDHEISEAFAYNHRTRLGREIRRAVIDDTFFGKHTLSSMIAAARALGIETPNICDAILREGGGA